MAEDRFKMVFEQMEKGMRAQPEVQWDMIKDTVEQCAEIKELAKIINDAPPDDKPITRSGTSLPPVWTLRITLEPVQRMKIRLD